jgi:3-hydroxymyristoyl/3-hydroxydecanoyl-(acyl carrier protein) dehydratase
VATLIENVAYHRSELDTTFLPAGQMLQIDRVFEIINGHLVCEMDVRDHWTFPIHFPTDPIFPGTLLIEAAGQAIAIWAWQVGARGRPRLVKVTANFESPVLPHDETVRLITTVRRKNNVFRGEVELSVLDKKIATVEALLIIVPETRLNR